MNACHTAFALSFTLLASAALAQTPAGPPQIDVATTAGLPLLESVAVDGQGNVTLLWEESRTVRRYGRRFSGADVPLGPDFLVTKRASFHNRAAANERGDTVMTWDEPAPGSGVQVRRLHPGLPPLKVTVNRRGNVLFRLAEDVDVDRQGRFVAVWSESFGNGGRLHAQRFNADGTRSGGEITIPGPGLQLDSRVAMNPATGDFVLVWVSSTFGQPSQILGQRFSFSGGPQGGVFQVNTTPSANVGVAPDVGRAEDGSFVVAWHKVRQRSPLKDVFIQRFDSEGKRRGGETFIALIPYFGSLASLAVAPEGHFLMAWTDKFGGPIHLRLFRADGTLAGQQEVAATSAPSSPQVAFGWDGTFVLGWTDLLGHLGDRMWEINYQRFTVPPGL
ncbi:MAG TPA: hypothetical protein VHC97_15925 [Thermoanaerobaculia bacterium]|jgi:hypothetical protein|nr:hypothetical protein [Thermoanaerobaculia bacterium]